MNANVQPGPSTNSAPIRALIRERRFDEALVAAENRLAAEPGDRDALLFRAMALRYLGRIDEALASLDALEARCPRFSRLYEERGHCHTVRRDAPRAIASFSRAVELNEALPASWNMLEGLYRLNRQAARSREAGESLAALRQIPPDIVAAIGLFLDGDLDDSERAVRAWLLEHGDHIEAMRLLARIGMARRVYDDAEVLLRAVLELAPAYHAVRLEHAQVLIDMHREAEAKEELERLLRDDPANRRHYQGLHATALVGLGQHEQAIGLYRELLDGTPGDADVQLSIAHALKTVGRTDEAISSYRRSAAARPGFGDAWWSLANLKTYRFATVEVEEMRRLEAQPGLEATDRLHLCFALGKALEDQGDYAGAFEYYQRGNELKLRENAYSPQIIEQNTRAQKETCTAAFFAAHAGWGRQDPDPIFIVGLPRSGSTLLEQILASHSQVEGTQELAIVQQLVTQLRGRDSTPEDPRYPRALTELTAEQAADLGARYIEGARAYRITDRPFFIDKMPNNFRHLGLIRLMLPNAKIIDARREPLACCFGNFKQLFARGQDFTYGLENIARYYRTYLELMRHWDAVLPGWILRVHHEDVVADLEGQVRRLLDFCGLPFEPQCIEFHRTERSVRTASSEQVRKPINRDGLDQWRHFEPWLGSLKDVLGDALQRHRE